MILVERMEGESAEDVVAYMESVLWAVDPEGARHFSEMLPFGRTQEWKRLLRIARRIEFGGKMFCEVEAFSCRLTGYMFIAVRDGKVSRDAIVAYLRGKTVPEMIDSGGVGDKAQVYLVRAGNARHLTGEELEVVCPASVRAKLPYAIGRDLDENE